MNELEEQIRTMSTEELLELHTFVTEELQSRKDYLADEDDD